MSNRKKPFVGFGRVSVADAQTAMPTPPVFFGGVSSWNGLRGSVARFGLEIHAASAVDVTVAELFGVTQVQIEIASDDVDVVDFANDELDIATHGLLAGYGPIQISTTGVLPAGLSALTDYYTIYTNAGTIQLATTLEGAMEVTANAVAFADAGSGTHSILGSVNGEPGGDGHNFLEGSNNSYKPILMSRALLGHAADGAFSLSVTEGYATSLDHDPRVVLYALQATLSLAVATTVSLYPLDDV